MKNKNILALFSLLLVYSGSEAQFTVDYGNISNEEISLKECAFDPGASAVVLVDEGLSDYTGDNGLMTFNHRRLKILKRVRNMQTSVFLLKVKMTWNTSMNFKRW
jgi:hypothetical protein